jgi:cell division septation protein DedD
MKSLAALLGGALAVISLAGYAQGRSDPWEDEHVDCATAPNPKGCRQRRARLEAQQAEVRKVCEVKPQNERDECMRTEWCRHAPDVARCNELQAKRAAAREVCESKPPEERKACYREALTR